MERLCTTLERRLVSKAFYNAEIEQEIKDRKMNWVFAGNKEDDLDSFMAEIERIRSTELYEHKICPDSCKKRGLLRFLIRVSAMIILIIRNNPGAHKVLQLGPSTPIERVY